MCYDKTLYERADELALYDKLAKNLPPCPFCGCDVTKFCTVSVIVPYRSEEYLKAKLKVGHFLGRDNGFVVKCPYCSTTGSIGMSEIEAMKKWSTRLQNYTGDMFWWKINYEENEPAPSANGTSSNEKIS